MGIYSLILLFLGILTIGLIYAGTVSNKPSHHIFFAILLLLFLVIFFTLHHHFEKTCLILIGGNLDSTVRLIRSWGIAAPLMSILLMVTQAIVAPIPAFLITAANGMVFGNYMGALISWIGALAGALTAFFIARLFGNMALKKIIRNKKTADFIKHAGEKRGFYVILISRLLPFISFDIISYMAGLSGIRPWAFILGTGLGMLPATIVYTVIGHEIPVMEKNFPIVLTYTIVFVFILVVFSIVQGLREKHGHYKDNHPES